MKRAFSLVELIITLVVGSMLLGLATASYQYFVASGSDLEARAQVDRIILAERSWAAQHGEFSLDALGEVEGDLTVLDGSVVARKNAPSVAVGDDGSLAVVVLDTDGRCVGSTVSPLLLDAVETRVTLELPCSARNALAA